MNITPKKSIRNLMATLLIGGLLFYAIARGQDISAGVPNVTHGDQASLRGLTELDVTRKADPFKRIQKDREPFVSDYVFQPPLIPHSIRNYEISTNANKCLSCHSFKKSIESGATKISVTHYATREGQVLSDVSPRRYFCLQCHVIQADTNILIENNFNPVDSLQ